MKVSNDISAVSRLLLTSVNTISDGCVTIGTVLMSVIVVNSSDVVDGVVVDELATAVVVITPLDTMESAVDIAVDG